MSASENLPNEMLWNIFKNLQCADLLKCRLVSVRWKHVVDSLCDDVWRQGCEEQFVDAKEAYLRANLSWQQLYKSMNIWPKLRLRTVKIRIQETEIEVSKFQLMPNGIIACPQSKGDLDFGIDNEIAYYDLATLELRNSYSFHDFPFYYFQENDHIIVLVNVENVMCVFPKVTMERFHVGKLSTLYTTSNDEFSNIILLDNTVYFNDSETNLCLCKLVENNGAATIIVERLPQFRNQVVAVKRINAEQVNIVDELGSIFSLIDGVLKELCFLQAANKIELLKTYGFKWSSPAIFARIVTWYDDKVELPKEMRREEAISCSHNDIVIVVTAKSIVNIYQTYVGESLNDLYYNDYDYYESDDCLSTDTPTLPSRPPTMMQMANKLKSINLYKKLGKEPRDNREVTQVEIVESVHGHKLVVIYDSRIHIVHLDHVVSGKRRAKKQGGPKAKITKNE